MLELTFVLTYFFAAVTILRHPFIPFLRDNQDRHSSWMLVSVLEYPEKAILLFCARKICLLESLHWRILLNFRFTMIFTPTNNNFVLILNHLSVHFKNPVFTSLMMQTIFYNLDFTYFPGETLLSPLVMCGPHGLKFKKPIELRLPHKGASNDSMAFSLKSSDSPVGEI